MINACLGDKSVVVDILASSFEDNQSVNYIIKQDRQKQQRIRLLMEYAFLICFHFGKVYLSQDRKACALILFPDRKKLTFKSMFWDLKLLLMVIGLSNILKVLKREGEIKRRHPGGSFAYLWFIGVEQACQGGGTGSALLQEVLNQTEVQSRAVYLETSTKRNIPWYERFGFKQYDVLDLGYQLFFFKSD